jgi:hypothetical protein
MSVTMQHGVAASTGALASKHSANTAADAVLAVRRRSAAMQLLTATFKLSIICRADLR